MDEMICGVCRLPLSMGHAEHCNVGKVKELKAKIKELEEVIKKCNQYAKIIKIGLTKNDAKYLEAEQIEKIAQKVLEDKDG